jgi:hypothetical protein
MSSSPVDPRARVPWLAFWTACYGFGALAQVPLLLATARLRRSALLLNLHAIFAVTCAMQGLLVWAGRPLDADPPFALCLTNASAVLANVPCQAGAALALVMKVCVSVCQCMLHVYARVMRALSKDSKVPKRLTVCVGLDKRGAYLSS